MNERCHLVVYNCGRLALFLDNFERIRGFRANRDRIVVMDCSSDPDSERRRLEAFGAAYGWSIGREFRFVRRSNWGIDQGARLDYFEMLRQEPLPPAFVWQFQEHYLDLTSPQSRWPSGTTDIDGTDVSGLLKGDTIPDGMEIDLDRCEQALLASPDLGVFCADRLGIGLFDALPGRSWLYVDGANFGVRTSTALIAFTPEDLEGCRRSFDGSYEWALFMELEWGRLLTNTACEWLDLESAARFNLKSWHRAQVAWPKMRHQRAPAEYGPIYAEQARRAGLSVG
jgi:hypothetical protein